MYKTKQGLIREDLFNSPATRQQKKILGNLPAVQVHRMMKNLLQWPFALLINYVFQFSLLTFIYYIYLTVRVFALDFGCMIVEEGTAFSNYLV